MVWEPPGRVGVCRVVAPLVSVATPIAVFTETAPAVLLATYATSPVAAAAPDAAGVTVEASVNSVPWGTVNGAVPPFTVRLRVLLPVPVATHAFTNWFTSTDPQ